MTNGRPRETHVRQASFCARASSESIELDLDAGRLEPLEPARRLGVRVARAGDDARDARGERSRSVHGGVVPQCAHGSIVTKSVAPRARSPAASSATTSPCRPPGSVTPSPTISPSRTTTAPTVGFGYARPAAAAGELERALEAHARRSSVFAAAR